MARAVNLPLRMLLPVGAKLRTVLELLHGRCDKPDTGVSNSKDGVAMTGGSNTIRFFDHKVASPAFNELYRQGMQLVEETAAYLDGDGRRAAKELDRPVATLYAAESMRLTTRLMQMASWLLLQRALANGEMSADQVQLEKNKIRLDNHPARVELELWNSLPEHFRLLVQRSLRLQTRMRRLDESALADELPQDDRGTRDNPVSTQLDLLKTAFGGR